jgi:hypothetical protein
MTPLLLTWLYTVCSLYQVEPAFALAVMTVESRQLDAHQNVVQEFRFGRLGKSPFWGPGGIRGRYKFGLDMADPKSNILVAVRALRGRDKRAVLRRYHGAPPAEYVAAVMSKYREFRRN